MISNEHLAEPSDIAYRSETGSGVQTMLIHELKLGGLLSFGPDTPPLKMQRLNVLVGPNGSGKSNFIEALGLLRSAATKLAAPIEGPGGGGVVEWVWKGASDGIASINAVIDNPDGKRRLRHRIEFCAQAQRFELVDEKDRERNGLPRT